MGSFYITQSGQPAALWQLKGVSQREVSERGDIYLWLIYLVWQKPTNHRKAIIIQLETIALIKKERENRVLKPSKKCNGWKANLSTNDYKTIQDRYKEMILNSSYLIPFTSINSRWMTYLKVKAKKKYSSKYIHLRNSSWHSGRVGVGCDIFIDKYFLIRK